MRAAAGVSLGSISGIQIRADWSLMVIFALISLGLATGIFPEWHPDWPAGLAWATAVAAAVLFFASVLLHELSHALVGRAQGVQIRRITLFMFGGMAEMHDEPPSWRAELGMAIVGPITSLLLGVLFIWLVPHVDGRLVLDMDHPRRMLGSLGPVQTLLLWLGPVNIVLAIFNMVPGFPLDGGRVLRAVMWGVSGDLRRATLWASRAGQGFAWLLMAAGLAMMLGLRIPLLGAGLVDGLWLAFVGWFLNNAARMSYQQLLLRQSLEHVPVRLLMQTNFVRIDPQMQVSTLLKEQTGAQRAFPVERGGQLLGMVSLGDLQKCPQEAAETLPASAIMTPAARLVTLSTEQDALQALEIMGQRDLSELPVVRRGELLGLVRREDMVKWLALHARGNRTA